MKKSAMPVALLSMCLAGASARAHERVPSSALRERACVEHRHVDCEREGPLCPVCGAPRGAPHDDRFHGRPVEPRPDRCGTYEEEARRRRSNPEPEAHP